MESINLYFVNFEFNASIIFLLREYSFATVGYNEIAYYGPLLSKLAMVGIALLAIIKAYKSEQYIFTSILFGLVIYYLFATTVHPWYISLVLIFSIFTRYKFGIVWSLLIMLSYYAYSQPDFQENLTYVIIEYVFVLIVMIVELIKYTKKDNFGLQIMDFFKIKDE